MQPNLAHSVKAIKIKWVKIISFVQKYFPTKEWVCGTGKHHVED